MPDFQQFVAERKLAPVYQIPFYAYWASRFIRFANDAHDKPLNLKIQLFIDDLKKDPKQQNWQIVQAENAIKLYMHLFLPVQKSILLPESPQVRPAVFPDAKTTLNKIREALRIKHYAYTTEKTYTEWFQRFHDYLIETKNNNWETDGADGEDVRDFLSHLAIKQRVTASTQNQAFNALLFLFRNVLQVDLTDLNKTVRAKRGPRLPAVLTQKEVLKLFRHLQGRDLLLGQLIYGTGMRLMEIARLRVADIDFAENAFLKSPTLK